MADEATEQEPTRGQILKDTAQEDERQSLLQPSTSRDPRVRRRAGAQRSRRMREARRRQAAASAAHRYGLSQKEIAQALRVSTRTLRRWRRQIDLGQTKLPLRGRPVTATPLEARREVVRFVHQVTGPCVGMPSLQALFPQVPPVALADLLRRYKKMWRVRYRQVGFQLNWLRPGAVWAMDHSEALHPIDGVYPYLFAVRDLASHCQLAWLPCRTQTAEEVRPVLLQLMEEHGRPLVLKSDNGSAFIANMIQELLADLEVAQLFSPVRRPQYNGALERSNATNKVYTQHQATLAGHPQRWTPDDVERARRLANSITRPWGHAGPTPDQAWERRSPVTLQERARFTEAVQQAQREAAVELGVTWDEPVGVDDRRRVDRVALQRVLVAQGYLEMNAVKRAPDKPKRRSKIELHAARDSSPHPCADKTDSDHLEKMLAEKTARVTMQAAPPRGGKIQPARVTPVRRGLAFISRTARRITLPLRRKKADMNPGS